MFESLPRWVLALVGTCIVLSLLMIWRGNEAEPPVAPQPGSIAARLPTRHGRAAPPADSGGIGSSEAAPPFRGAAAPRTVEPGKFAGQAPGGRRLADEPLPTAREVEHAAGGRQQPAGGAGDTGKVPPMNLASGTRLAAPFQGSGESALDQMAPVVDENVYYDIEDGAYFSADARFAFGDNGGLNNEAGTISFWIQPSWNGADETDNSLIQLRTDAWPNRLQIFKNGHFLRFLFTDNSGSETNVGIDISQPPNIWTAGQWHHIAVTWGESVTTLYVDAAIKGNGQYMGKLEVPWGTDFYVGSDHPRGSPGADAILDNLVIIDHKLSAEEILGEYRKLH